MSAKKKNRKRKLQTKKSSRSESNTYRRLVLTRATEALLGTKVDRIEYPGGKNRESIRLILQDKNSVIATRRSDMGRARTEVSTLKALNKHNAPVPRLLANNHSHVLIQEEIQGERLSLALKDANEAQYTALVSAALDSMGEIHAAATAENLESSVTALGDQTGWIAGLIERPAIIGKFLKVEAPTLEHKQLIELLSVKVPRFVKWDSRPGNAIVDETGRVVWFDWEHAGTRNRLDDVAWILGDEFLPEYVEAESSIIKRFVPRFADTMSDADAFDYLMAYGSFHMIVRLGLILKHMDGEWWDLGYCIEGDKVGVNLLCAQRLCARGARWSSRNPLTKPLEQWFSRVAQCLEKL